MKYIKTQKGDTYSIDYGASSRSMDESDRAKLETAIWGLPMNADDEEIFDLVAEAVCGDDLEYLDRFMEVMPVINRIYSKDETIKALSNALYDLVKHTKEYDPDALKCDHSVGLCGCGIKSLIAAAEEAIQIAERQ